MLESRPDEVKVATDPFFQELDRYSDLEAPLTRTTKVGDIHRGLRDMAR